MKDLMDSLCDRIANASTAAARPASKLTLPASLDPAHICAVIDSREQTPLNLQPRELDALRGWPVSAVIVESTWRALDVGDWRGQITPKQVRASLTSWIAQGHTIIMAHDHDKAAEIVRDILYYAARYRWKEARELVGEVVVAKEEVNP